MTAVQMNPYLIFHDRAREAMEFYRDVFGGDLSMDTFGSAGASGDPANDDLIMHAHLATDRGFVLMASDSPDEVPGPSGPISLSLSGDDEPTLRTYFDALAAGGTVTAPLEKAPWGDQFGMCTDRFGTNWMVNIGSSST